MGFLFVPLAINFAGNFKPATKHGFKLIFCCFAGLIPIYFGGVIWLHLGIGLSLKKAILSGVVPFIPGALIKITVTYVIFTNLRERNIVHSYK